MLTLLSLFSHSAQAVPLQVTQQGRILDANGASISGSQMVVFRVYDDPTAGASLWEEMQTVNFTNGYYAAVLGADEQNNPLDSDTLSLYPLYLELQLDSNAPMTPRHALNSTPYAQMAGIAQSVDGGAVNASEVSVGLTPVIDSGGHWVGPSITVDWSSVTNIPSDIADGDNDTQLSEVEVETMVTNDALDLAGGSTVAGNPILTESATTLDDLMCSEGEVVGWDGGAWICQSDSTMTEEEVVNIVQNTTIELSPSTTLNGEVLVTTSTDADSLAELNCTHDQVIKYDETTEGWYCAEDLDTDTQLGQSEVLGFVEAGSVNLAGGSQVNSRIIVSQPSDCDEGQVLVFDAVGNDWSCGEDSDTTLTSAEMQTMIEAMTLNLQSTPQVNGADVLTTESSIVLGQLDASESTSGQILISDGSVINWGDLSSGDCSLVSQHPEEAHIVMNCGGSSLKLPFYFEPQIDVGINHSCFLQENGIVKCWGIGGNSGLLEPSARGFISIAAGSSHNCGILSDGSIECWGSSSNGQLNTPNGHFFAISSGYYHSCAIEDGGSVQCWGMNNTGQSNSPNGTFLQISSGFYHNCGINSSNNIQCWGSNGSGQSSPPSGTFVQISTGYYHNCALDSAGNIQCWGRDDYGQSSPPSGTFVQIAAGENHNCALEESGSLQCWGNNEHGQTDPQDASFLEVSAGGEHTCGIDSGGSVQCWGKDAYGQVSDIP